MKHAYLPGEKHCAFCAIDPYSREAVIHTASSPSRRNAKASPQKVTARFGKDITIVNGSGNMKDAQEYPASQRITRYWTRPPIPQGKALR